jgi:cytochrome b561
MTYGTLRGGYPAASKWLHWLVALCVLITIPIALWMKNAANPALQNNLYNFHKSLGVLIFVLLVLRLANRLIVGAPAPEPTLKRWERAVSSAVHGLLYVLLLALPVVGYVANSAYGAAGTPTPFFGLFELPPIVAPNEALAERLFTLHRRMGWVAALLAALHIAAALQHYFLRRDGVLQRMLPRALGGI